MVVEDQSKITYTNFSTDFLPPPPGSFSSFFFFLFVLIYCSLNMLYKGIDHLVFILVSHSWICVFIHVEVVRPNCLKYFFCLILPCILPSTFLTSSHPSFPVSFIETSRFLQCPMVPGCSFPFSSVLHFFFCL